MKYNLILLIFLTFLLALTLPASGEVSKSSQEPPVRLWQNWYVSAYASQWIGGVGSTSLSGIFAFRNLQSSYLYTVSAGRELGRPFASLDPLYIDFEGQIGTHTGDQEHSEFMGVFIARWEKFPWDHELDSSFSVGQGLSWASEVPEREKLSSKGSAHLLNYVLFEAAVSPWEEKRWEGFFRVHHRSGVFGTFSDVFGASNFIGFGVRYRR